MIASISAEELNTLLTEWKECLIIDVRSSREFDETHITQSIHIPLMQLPEKIDTIDTKKELILVCYSGARSREGCRFLAAHGIHAKNLEWGMHLFGRYTDKITSSSLPKRFLFF